MSITFEATYENGVLRPLTPVPFKENEKVTVVVDQEVGERTHLVQDTSGIMGGNIDAESIRRIAEDIEFSIYESP